MYECGERRADAREIELGKIEPQVLALLTKGPFRAQRCWKDSQLNLRLVDNARLKKPKTTQCKSQVPRGFR